MANSGGKVHSIKQDGSLGSGIAGLNTMYAEGHLEKLVIIAVRNDQPLPIMAFSCTESPIEELGLLELAKIQALTTREIL